MPNNSTMNSWLFPPRTREVQFDEKWSFVGKKEKHCDPNDPDDDEQGDNWDHVALDPEHRLVVSVVPGKRSPDHVRLLLEDFRRRTAGRLMNLMTSDEYPAYREMILAVYGQTITPQPTGRPGRPRAPYQQPPPELLYATVHKEREGNRVVRVDTRLIFGTVVALAAALVLSLVSARVNTVFIERHNGSDRNRNERKTRKTYCFSKDWQVHEAVTYFTMFSYNFCWPVRTLRERDDAGRLQEPRTPAMAAGLADHVWTLREWLTFPGIKSFAGRNSSFSSWQC
jgi:IS1 family transposase